MTLKPGDTIKCFTLDDMINISSFLTSKGYSFIRRSNFITITKKTPQGYGTRIKRLRKSIYFEPQEVADEIGISLETYLMWESETKVPKGKAFDEMCFLMDTTQKYILEGEK